MSLSPETDNLEVKATSETMVQGKEIGGRGKKKRKKSPVMAKRRANQRKSPPLPKGKRFRRCVGKVKKLQCPSCRLEDCGKCDNCRNRSSRHQACQLKPRFKCITYIRQVAASRKGQPVVIVTTDPVPVSSTKIASDTSAKITNAVPTTTIPEIPTVSAMSNSEPPTTTKSNVIPILPTTTAITSTTMVTDTVSKSMASTSAAVIATGPAAFIDLTNEGLEPNDVSTTSAPSSERAIDISKVQQELNTILLSLSSCLEHTLSQVRGLQKQLSPQPICSGSTPAVSMWPYPLVSSTSMTGATISSKKTLVSKKRKAKSKKVHDSGTTSPKINDLQSSSTKNPSMSEPIDAITSSSTGITIQPSVVSTASTTVTTTVKVPISSSTIKFGDADLKQRMKEVLSKVRVNLYITKCGISGPPSTGKTHFRALLLGKKRPSHRQSTSLSTRADEVMTGDISGVLVKTVQQKSGAFKWTELNKDPWIRLIANTVCEEILKDLQPGIDYDFQKDCLDCSDLYELIYSHLCVIIADDINSIKSKRKARKRRTLHDIHLLYLVDTGGQPQFQEILPNFVRSSINFLVHNLTQALTDCPPFEYSIDGCNYSVPEVLRMSNISIIDQTVRSICSTSHAEPWKKEYPAVAIVGTFKDKCTSDTYPKMLREKSKRIKTELKQYTEAKPPMKCDIIECSRDHCIFPLDASENGWESNTTVLEKLKVEIDKYGKQRKVGNVPISFFIFLQNLRKVGKPYINKKEYTEIAHDTFISLSSKEVGRTLLLFNDVNLILHFPKSKKLRNLIFLDPNFLYDRVTDIIVKSFDSPDSTTRQGNNFYRTGIFTNDVLFSIPRLQELEDPQFTLDHFLNLLEDLNIICKLEDGSYLMPCVLQLEDPKSVSKEFEEHLKEIEGKMALNSVSGPLVISFGDNISPRGLFCAVVVYLTKNSGWKLQQDSNCIRRRNYMEFSVNVEEEISAGAANQYSVETVAIFDKTSHVEIYTTCKKENCFDIKGAVIVSIIKACKSMKYEVVNMNVNEGFYCTSCSSDVGLHHTVVKKNSKKEFAQRCSKGTQKKGVTLDHRQMVWFHSNSRGLSYEEASLTMPVLFNELIPKTNEWRSIGTLLELTFVELDRIYFDSQDEKSRFQKVLETWYKNGSPPFTWKTIIEVLRAPMIQENRLATELNTKYCGSGRQKLPLLT